MGLRFRRTFRLVKGLHINLSKSGLSLSVGRPGATINLSKGGARTTVGLPGTGLSWRASHPWKSKTKAPKPVPAAALGTESAPTVSPSPPADLDRVRLRNRAMICLGLIIGWAMLYVVLRHG
jgi:hypothetical protein